MSTGASDVADIQAAIDFWQSNTCVSYKLTPNPKGDALEFFKGTGYVVDKNYRNPNY